MCDYTEKDLKGLSKVFLWEQLGAVEDERNQLLDLCVFILNNKDKMSIPNDLCLHGDNIISWLVRLTGIKEY